MDENTKNILDKFNDIDNYLKNSDVPFELKEKLNNLEKIVSSTINNQKFGLVFERSEESIEKLCNEKIPYLEKIENKTINKGANNKHILIEGDNYASLKLLLKTHRNKIDFIYIDPPYNTGNKDFKYGDSFVDKNDEYRHSKWLNFMTIRLKLAKSLLTENGIIAISVDDKEQAHLKLLCDSTFGENNFLGNLIWKSKSGGANDSSAFGIDHEYVLCYAKNFLKITINNDMGGTVTTSYNQEDEFGKYALDRLDKQSLGYQPSLDFPIIGPDGKEYVVQHKDPNHKKARWRWSKDTVEEKYNELVFKYPYVYTKNYEKKDGVKPRSILFDERFGRTRTGSTDLSKILNKNDFPYPKPVALIKYLVSVCCNNSGTILDFFAGSGTTGQAVLELNKEDGGNRKFILCTNNENNICEDITYNRIKTILTGIKPDGEKFSECIPDELNYFKVDFLEKNKKINLNTLIVGLSEIEKIKNNKNYLIITTDEEMLELNENILKDVEILYVSSDVIETNKLIRKFNIKVINIPDYFYNEEELF